MGIGGSYLQSELDEVNINTSLLVETKQLRIHNSIEKYVIVKNEIIYNRGNYDIKWSIKNESMSTVRWNNNLTKEKVLEFFEKENIVSIINIVNNKI